MAHQIPLYKASAATKRGFTRRRLLATIAGLILVVLIASELGYGLSVSSKGNVEVSIASNDPSQNHRGLVSSILNGPAPAAAQAQPTATSTATPTATATQPVVTSGAEPAGSVTIAPPVQALPSVPETTTVANKEPVVAKATSVPATNPPAQPTVAPGQPNANPVQVAPPPATTTQAPAPAPTAAPAQPKSEPNEKAPPATKVPAQPTAVPPTATQAPAPTAIPKPILPVPTLPVKVPPAPTPTPKNKDKGDNGGKGGDNGGKGGDKGGKGGDVKPTPVVVLPPLPTVKVNLPGLPKVKLSVPVQLVNNIPAKPAEAIKMSNTVNQTETFNLSVFLTELFNRLLFES